ncbi:MAG: 2-C-methyl-D-erythritol 2,4-cyclodiphosphate synthase [Acidimicrobiia bacterium]
MRVGLGVDAHRFGGKPPLRLGGVVVDEDLGVEATSDGDVVAHALADALLGAAALGDLGSHYPSSDRRWRDADSLGLLAQVAARVREEGVEPVYADVTVVAEQVRIAPHRQAMRERLADALGLPVESISVKATTTDGLGLIGAGEGLAALAVVTVR